MRHLGKNDRSIFITVLFASVLTVVAACSEVSSPFGAPNVVQAGTVSSVQMTLAQSTLATGQITQATVVATAADGAIVAGTINFSSQNPSVATVSPKGLVTGVTAGVATIRAAVGSHVASANVTVESGVQAVPQTLPAFYDFNDGKSGPFRYLGADVTAIDYPVDPTNSGRGKVNRIRYHPGNGLSSNDINMELNTAHAFRYGETIWFKGDLYIPSTLSDGVTPKTASQNDDTRKLLDYFNAPPWPRLILGREHGRIYYSVGQLEAGVFHVDVRTGDTGIVIADDTWYTIEVRWTLNSADGVPDAVLEIYVNNSTTTPDFRLATGLSPITQQNGAPYFKSFRFGTQVTTYSGEAAYSEYRYWDNVGFSTTRMR